MTCSRIGALVRALASPRGVPGLLLAGALAFVAAVGQAESPSRPSSVASTRTEAQNVAACRSLIGLKVESGAVEGTERLQEGDTVVGGDTGGAKVAADLCLVRLRLQPAAGSDIRVEVWLPESWNNKMYGVGGAGFDGGLGAGSANSMNKVVQLGYAAVATDVGHKPAPSVEAWVHRQPEKVIDFGHRGNHLAAVVAKQVIASYYGAPARHAYFLGCSNGGREALMEASRYPDDYDGIVAGAPAMRYSEVLTQLIWFHDAVHGPGGAVTLGSKLGLVNQAVLKRCDRLDGVTDGILENPSECQFDPVQLRCEAKDTRNCLTDAEVGAFRKIYGGPRLRTGEQVFSGPALGSEDGPQQWIGWVVPERTATFGQDFYRWFVHDDPAWKVENFDINRDYPLARERLAATLNSDNPDLSAFARRGGKLIVYHGWYDPGITPTETIKYFEEVRERLGSRTDDHVRLFMVPGMAHCADGPGATSFDMLPALERWVEQGKPPERITAVKPNSDPAVTHPLCPWPRTARYNGTGSTDDAASFTCKAPDSTVRVDDTDKGAGTSP